MSQDGNTNNSNFLNDCFNVASNQEMIRFGIYMLFYHPELCQVGLNMLNQYPDMTMDWIHTQSNLIQTANQSTNLAQEKEVLAKQNEELKEQNAKLKTELSNANKKITDLENKINKMEKNTIKMNTANLKTSSIHHSILAKLNKLKNESDQSQEQKPVLENSTVNQI